MSDHDALLAAILADPADDTARLVYADWLTENGQSDRGEFIRVEIELARTPPNTEDDERRRSVLLRRRDQLLKQHKDEWLGQLLPYARETSFHRGFLQSLDVPVNTFLQNGGRWFAHTPLTHLKITHSQMWDDSRGELWWAKPLFSSPLLERLEVFDLEATGLAPADIRLFARIANLPRLRELVLAGNEIRSEGAAKLAGMQQLANLESLDVRANHITDSGARAIAESPFLARLKELRISRNRIRDRSWNILSAKFGPALMG